MCSYQEVEYTVSLLGKNRNTSILAKGRVLSPSQPIGIDVTDKTQLVRNKIYEVVVAMALPGFEENYQPLPIRKKIDTTTQEDSKTDKQSTFSKSHGRDESGKH